MNMSGIGLIHGHVHFILVISLVWTDVYKIVIMKGSELYVVC